MSDPDADEAAAVIAAVILYLREDEIGEAETRRNTWAQAGRLDAQGSPVTPEGLWAWRRR